MIFELIFAFIALFLSLNTSNKKLNTIAIRSILLGITLGLLFLFAMNGLWAIFGIWTIALLGNLTNLIIIFFTKTA